MFTGIVEDLGAVKGITKRLNGASLLIESGLLGDAAIGDSISINGVCLTVVKKGPEGAAFDVVRRTLEETTLKKAKVGDKVNIERALKADSRIGGHFVSGHIDCVGMIKDIRGIEGAISIEIEIPRRYEKFIIEKGSVAIDGISLTVADIKGVRFTVHIITHTMNTTTLASKRIGDGINMEFDLLIKQSLREKEVEDKGGITENFLRDKGFI